MVIWLMKLSSLFYAEEGANSDVYQFSSQKHFGHIHGDPLNFEECINIMSSKSCLVR